MLGAMACALGMVTACMNGPVGENTNDSTKQIETTDETQLTDEQWREQWLNGEFLANQVRKKLCSHTEKRHRHLDPIQYCGTVLPAFGRRNEYIV